MKVLVTGGAGFIGSHVVDKLIEKNVETSVLVSGFRSNNHPNVINMDATVIKGDLLSKSDLEKATKNVDYVCHLGAVLSHYYEFHPEYTIDVNIKGTLNLKNACVKNQVKRIVFASSSFIYGDSGLYCWPWTHENRLEPKDLYGVTKLAGERILQTTHPNKIDYTILRMFNVYGPRCYPDGLYTAVIPTWITTALKQKPLIIHGNGNQKLDFVYVEDVAEAWVNCLLTDKTRNEIFEVGSGLSTSLNLLASLINTSTNNSAEPQYIPDHPAYIYFSQAHILKISPFWRPKTKLFDGLAKTIEFYKELDYCVC